MDAIRVLAWSEGTAPEDVYPNGINSAVAAHLNERNDVVARSVGLDDVSQGVSDDRLEWADALFWWGHRRHDEVADETVDRVENAVVDDGLGFVALHSGHYARPFTRLVGTSGDLGEVRRVNGETERIAIHDPTHPIARGIEDFALPRVEMFGEPFDVPDPETTVFHSTFSEGGEFRSGLTFQFGAGRGFYFRPGHETFRIYHHPRVVRILRNAARWVADDE